MNIRYRGLFLFIGLPIAFYAQVKEPPFWNEIKAFKKSDSINFPAPNQILFVGSSSFRLWNDLQKKFPGYPIINRGFGGSTLKDVNFYFAEIVKPYHARQIVIYCGDNDFANDRTLPVDSVLKRLETLIAKIRSADKNVKITYISIKPSPKRKELAPKYIEANEKAKQSLKKMKNTSYVDVYSKMIDKKGQPLRNIFLPDSLHMNSQGYAIWQKEIKAHLIKKIN
ncbi:MAG TPA: GDSL-type esterase/lipase family protein [Cyclobacteriaceae bacterium]|jgi:lysophospholipase L1-like esterase|nr:GDSL-type esterase/lipase family protein [Cyclobacteriaceae bacterium]